MILSMDILVTCWSRVKNLVDQASRLVSTVWLKSLLTLHLPPINLLVSKVPSVP